MRFGTYYFLQAPPALAHPEVVRREIEQMAWTEELGFDSIWLTEHHFIEYGLSVSPAVLAAAAAMRTRRVRIGLAAAILPFHDPVRLVKGQDGGGQADPDRKSTRLNSSHVKNSYAVFCLKKKKKRFIY